MSGNSDEPDPAVVRATRDLLDMYQEIEPSYDALSKGLKDRHEYFIAGAINALNGLKM